MAWQRPQSPPELNGLYRRSRLGSSFCCVEGELSIFFNCVNNGSELSVPGLEISTLRFGVFIGSGTILCKSFFYLTLDTFFWFFLDG